MANDETPTLAAQSGVTLDDALKAISAQNEEMARLRNALTSQQATIEKMNALNTARKPGTIPVERRICNNCGAEVAEGARCKVHPRERINELGTGIKHNVPQVIIVRQV